MIGIGSDDRGSHQVYRPRIRVFMMVHPIICVLLLLLLLSLLLSLLLLLLLSLLLRVIELQVLGAGSASLRVLTQKLRTTSTICPERKSMAQVAGLTQASVICCLRTAD